MLIVLKVKTKKLKSENLGFDALHEKIAVF